MFSFILFSMAALAPPGNGGYVVDNSQDSDDLQDKIVIYGRKLENPGDAISVSQGTVSQGEIDQRPILRSGEILEFVPGMVVTQHSGSGKANQYFLRGFNLDHGTDFATSIDNMPVNKRTHGHGQGYTDLSFITPEFIQRIDFQKGPYHAEDGDFSTAGSAQFVLADAFSKPLLQVEAGVDNYFRTVMASNMDVGDDTLFVGFEHHIYDGPWTDVDEDVGKTNLLLKYSGQSQDSRYSITFMGYDNQWNSADQVPDRAVQQGLINRLGSLDTDVGGEASRYSLSFMVEQQDLEFDAYLITSDLDLFSNFTYFLDDPVNGDEFQQVDERNIYGGSLVRKFDSGTDNSHIHHRLGVQFRYDDIDNVGLYKTANRQRLSTTRQDSVDQYSVGIFWNGEMHLTEDLIFNLGVRYDQMNVDVQSNVEDNSGTENGGLLSSKASLQYRIDDSWSTYLNAGQSFHSNDARGATITIDPSSGEPADAVDLLVRGNGAEFGVRYFDPGHLNVSMGIWTLELDSELIFVGDAGNTEPGRASRRSGIEFTGYYWLDDKLSLDVELAWTRSRFTEDADGEGDRIDGSLPFVGSMGLVWNPIDNWRTALRVRHFGKRTLDSFNTEQSDAFTVANASLTYSFDKWETELQILNLFDSDDNDIDYFYASRLPGEPAEGIEDHHYHPIEPRAVRLQVRYLF